MDCSVSSLTYAQVYDWDNLYLAWRKAARGKRGRVAAARFEYHLEDNGFRVVASHVIPQAGGCFILPARLPEMPGGVGCPAEAMNDGSVCVLAARWAVFPPLSRTFGRGVGVRAVRRANSNRPAPAGLTTGLGGPNA